MGVGDVVLMGVVNVTPNSFSDGGEFFSPDDAIRQAKLLVREGATILDVGAEASSFFRAGVEAVEDKEQLRRLRPVVEGLVEKLPAGVKISIDTRSTRVAHEMLEAGADWINDISAGTHDEGLFLAVSLARTRRGERAGMVLMHMSDGYPATAAVDDPDIVESVGRYLRGRFAAAVGVGIDAEKVWVDPGIGFGKTMADNWRLALGAEGLLRAGVLRGVVVGLSRKRFLETPPPTGALAAYGEMLEELKRVAAEMPGVHARDAMTALVTAVVARRLREAGVEQVHRVHHVTLVRRALRLVGT